MTNDELVQEYAGRIAPLLPLAKRAYGSRDTVSPQHDASREYTRLLCEFYKAGGSLLDLAGALGVTYAGMRRRITTADVSPQSKHPRQKYTDAQYSSAVTCILECKETGTADYHVCLKNHYDLGYSMARIAREMGLSSASPLYYGVYRIKIEGS